MISNDYYYSTPTINVLRKELLELNVFSADIYDYILDLKGGNYGP